MKDEYENKEGEELVLRGELIMKKKIFEEKYKNKFSNSRNLVAGIINKKTLDKELLKDIDFVIYEVIKPELKPSKQLELLEKNKLNTVKYEINKDISNKYLSEILLNHREDYEYTIDGIVCTNDEIYKRESKNPDHAFAFKLVLSDQEAEAKVIDVLWTASKDGILKPRIKIEPIKIGNVNINYATGFNAKFIKDNKIGVGAIVRIIRSGDVIPYIKEVRKGVDEVLFPDEDYEWNETNVDIILKNKKGNKEIELKQITKFFKDLNVEGLGEKNIKKIIESGGDTIEKILEYTIEDFKKVENFKEKMATKV